MNNISINDIKITKMPFEGNTSMASPSSSVDIAQQSDLRQRIHEGNSWLAPSVPHSSACTTSMEDLGLTFGNMPLRSASRAPEVPTGNSLCEFFGKACNLEPP